MRAIHSKGEGGEISSPPPPTGLGPDSPFRLDYTGLFPGGTS